MKKLGLKHHNTLRRSSNECAWFAVFLCPVHTAMCRKMCHAPHVLRSWHLLTENASALMWGCRGARFWELLFSNQPGLQNLDAHGHASSGIPVKYRLGHLSLNQENVDNLPFSKRRLWRVHMRWQMCQDKWFFKSFRDGPTWCLKATPREQFDSLSELAVDDKKWFIGSHAVKDRPDKRLRSGSSCRRAVCDIDSAKVHRKIKGRFRKRAVLANVLSFRFLGSRII